MKFREKRPSLSSDSFSENQVSAGENKYFFSEENDKFTIIPPDYEVPAEPEKGNMEKEGLVKVSLVHIRKSPSHSSELVTQAVMGEEAEIIEEEGDWYKVKLLLQQDYSGWVEKEAIQTGKKYDNENLKALVIEGETFIYEKPDVKSPVLTRILLGSVLELEDIEQGDFFVISMPDSKKGWIEKRAISLVFPDKNNKNIAPELILLTADKFINTEYLWGGMSKDGIDCSGFVHMVYRANGIELHRDADIQFLYDGERVRTETLKAGDLVFFKRDGKIVHVGMYLDNNDFIHSSSKSGKVTINSLKSPFYEPYYAGAKRIISPSKDSYW